VPQESGNVRSSEAVEKAGQRMKVFISHALEDERKCREVSLALKKAQLAPWDSTEIWAGQDIRESLRMAIERCDACVFIATANSANSRWCHAETGAFWSAGKPVVVYVAGGKLLDRQVPDLLRGSKRTTSLQEVVKSVAQFPETTASARVGKRPANVFWLAHDLTRAVHIASFEPHQTDQLAERIFQAIHHLDQTGLEAPDEWAKLAAAWASVKGNSLSGPDANLLADKIAEIRNDVIAKLVALQQTRGAYAPYPSPELKDRVAKEAGLTRE
jgi:hypothetical protein